LSTDFLIEFKDEINWDFYLYNENFIFSMVKKFAPRLSISKSLLDNSNLNEEQLKEIKKLLNLKNMFTNKKTL
jgi:hypothetical protein